MPLESVYFSPRAFGVPNSDEDLINEDKVFGNRQYRDIKDLTPRAAYQYAEEQNKYDLREARKAMVVFGVPVSVPAVSGMVLIGLALFSLANLSSLIASLKRDPLDEEGREPRDVWIALSEVGWIRFAMNVAVVVLPLGAMLATACVELVSVLTEQAVVVVDGEISIGDKAEYAKVVFAPAVCGLILVALCSECKRHLVALQRFASSGRFAHGDDRLSLSPGKKVFGVVFVIGLGSLLVVEWVGSDERSWLGVGVAIFACGIVGILAKTIVDSLYEHREVIQMLVERDVLLSLHGREMTYGELLRVIDDQRRLDVALKVLAVAKLIERIEEDPRLGGSWRLQGCTREEDRR